MSLRVLGPRVLLRPMSQPMGSDIITLTDKQPPTVGEVVSVGTNRCAECDAKIPSDVATGDVVLIPRTAGQEITIDGEPFWVVPIAQVLSYWKDDHA